MTVDPILLLKMHYSISDSSPLKLLLVHLLDYCSDSSKSDTWCVNYLSILLVNSILSDTNIEISKWSDYSNENCLLQAIIVP